jgi:DNA-directed RNA polymerase specialized sigma24 family protein
MRRCVLLRIDQGLKYREIASIMRVSIDTVKTQLHQARHRLKERLQEYFDLEVAAGE